VSVDRVPRTLTMKRSQCHIALGLLSSHAQYPSATTPPDTGNQLSGLTDAELGLSHLSSSLLRSADSWDPPTRRSSFGVASSAQNRQRVLIEYGPQRRRSAAPSRSGSQRSRSARRGEGGHVVESRPARLVGERAAGMVGSGTWCQRPSTVDQSC
jgi:hypothetical protein